MGSRALHVLLLLGGLVLNGPSHAAGDVDLIVAPAPLAKGLPAVRFLRDEGDLAILDYGGNYDRFTSSGEVNAAPRMALAREYLAHHPDAYDFLMVFSTFEFDTGDATAFYLGIHNDVAGIGRDLFDHRAEFGSEALQGYIDMAALSRYELDALAPGFDGTLDLMLHEVMHRWGVAVEFIDEAGQRSAELLGRHDIHWGFFVDSDASVMYGADWREHGAGTFTAINVRRGFSPLDLYLAGFLPPEAVPEFFFIDSPDGDPDALPPDVGTSVGGVARPVTIDRIIAAEGDRVPGVAESQHRFRAGFVLLTRPGDPVSAPILGRLRHLRREFQRRFSVETRGLGVVDVGVPPPAPQPSDPAIVPVPEIAGPPVDLIAAAEWLRARQQADGAWSDKGATAIRDTAMARAALIQLDLGAAEVDRAAAWLRSRTARNHDERAWLLWSGALSGAQLNRTADELLAERRPDGGWGFDPALGASPLDTALAIRALRAQGLLAVGLDPATAAFVTGAATDGAGWGATAGGAGHSATHALMLAALAGLALDPDLVDRAIGALVQRQSAGGDFGSAHETALALSALALHRDRVEITTVDRAVTALQARQAVDGSWEGSVYATALAVLALRGFDRPNLELLADVGIDPLQPVAGEPVAISFNVRNTGILEVPATAAALLAAEPPGGALLAGPVAVPALAAGADFTAELIADTSGLLGPQRLFLWADAAQAIEESSEADNVRAIEFSVAEAGDEPDLAVVPGSAVVSPQVISQLPAPVRIDVEVRNLSTLAHDAVAVVLILDDGAGGRELDRVAPAFAAREARIVRLEGAIDAADGGANLRVVVDPDGLIAERNEQNNEIRVQIPTGDALDLAIRPGDLVVTTAAPTLGRDLAIELTARNAGTIDAPPARLLVEAVQGGDVRTVADTSIQLAAGQAAVRNFVWRAAFAGEVEVRAAIDPDDLIAEGDEANNLASLALIVADVTQPNLVIDAGAIAFAPEPALEGQPLEIELTVQNASTVAAGAFAVEVYEGVPGSGGGVVETLEFAGLAAAGALTGRVQTPPLTGGGERLFYVVVDAHDDIDEFDETDNGAFATVAVQRLPDLSVAPTAIVLTPATPLTGEPISAQIAVDNLGQQPAEQVSVDLFEVDREGNALAVAAGTLSSIAPGGTGSITLEWRFGQAAAGVERLRVVVDLAERIPEIGEQNNRAEIALQTANREFLVTERYFSPNGDGVRDETAIAFEFDQPASFVIEIDDRHGRTVRRFAGGELADTRAGAIDWDGRDDRGVVVRDGDYLVRLLEAGAVRAQALVTVDTNRTPPLDAWGGEAAYFTDLRCAVRDLRPPRFSADGRYLLTDRITALDGTRHTGLYRVATRGAAAESVIPQSWWQAVGLSPFVDSFWPLPDGRIVFATAGRVYLLTAPLATPIRLDTGSLPSFEVLDADAGGVLLELDLGLERYWLISLDPAVAPLKVVTPSRTMTFAGALASGWLMLDRGSEVFDGESRFVDRLWLVPADPGRAAELLNAGPDEVEWSVSADRRIVASVAQEKPWERFSHEPGSYARVRVARIDRDPIEWIVEREYRSERRGAVAVSSAPGNRLLVLIGPEWRAEVYDSAGSLSGQLALPAQLLSDYAADFAAPASYLFGRWADGPGGAGRTVIWSSDRPEFLVEFALHILNDSETKTVPSSTTHLSRLLMGDLDRAELTPVGTVNYGAGAAVFPGQLELPEPEALTWLSRTDQVLIRPRFAPDTWRLDLAPDGGLTALGSGLVDLLWPASEGAPVKRLYLPSYPSGVDPFRCAGSGAPKLIFESADNLITHLEAAGFAAVIELRGVAADRHFLSHRLEWAREDDPGQWFALTSPSGAPVVDEEFATWVPPEPGTYRVRLTASDRAGNSDRSERTVTWLEPASLADVRLEPTHVSPNGDGRQDAAVLSFRVLEPLNLEATIETADGQVVRVLSGQYPVVTGAIETLVWDGRDGAGLPVAEGEYLLRVLNRRFRITLDLSPPVLELALPPMLERGEAPCGLLIPGRCIEVAIDEPNLDRTRLEYRTASGDFSELAPVAAGRAVVIDRDAPAAPRPETRIMRTPLRIPYGEGLIRLSATDLAGNSSRLDATRGADQLAAIAVLAGADGGAALHLETAIGATVDEYRIESFDPAAQAWVARPKAPLTQAQSAPFELPPLTPDAARHRPLLPLEPATDLPPIDPVRLRARALIGGGELVSNELVFANPYGRLLRLEAEAGVAALLSDLAAESAPAAALAGALWRAHPVTGTALSRALLIAELGPQQPSLLAVASGSDPRYSGAQLFGPRAESTEGGYYAAIFHFPTRPCAGYELAWRGSAPAAGAPANSTATNHSRSCLSLDWTAAVLAGEFCAGEPSGRVELTVAIESDDPQIVPTALNLLRIDQGSEVLVANVVAPAIGRDYRFEIDHSPFMSGQLAYLIEATDSAGDRVRRSLLLPVDRQPTTVAIDYPPDGATVCAESEPGGAIALSVAGHVADDALFRYRVSLAPGHDGGGFAVVAAQPDDPRACADGARWTDGDCLLLQGELLGELAHTGEVPGGEVTALVEALDWSGAWQCGFSRFEVDAAVDVDVAPGFGVFSPNGDGQRDFAEVAIRAREPAVAQVAVYPAAFEPGAGWSVIGPVLGVAAADLALAGSGAFAWDGSGLADGRYALEFALTDGCGLTRRAFSFGEIDTTPPALAITAPAAGSTLSAIVEVRGGIDDPNPGPATLEYGQSGNWLPLASPDAPAAAGSVLATWATAGLAPGPYQLRLSARDVVFNQTEFVIDVTVGGATSLLWGLEAQPPVFSPDGDGVSDTSTVQLGVQADGAFTVEVRDPSGASLATLATARALAPGTHRFGWNGAGAGGAIVPDGRDAFWVEARDPSGVLVQTETVSVTVDTTPPALDILRPANGFARATGFAAVSVDDLTLRSVRAWIEPLDPAGPIEQVLSAKQPGVHPAGDLAALGPGRYALRVEAADAAGNVGERRREFELDDRAPQVAIDAPAAGSVLGLQPVTVSGSVADDNLAGYRLQVRPGGTGPAWSDLVVGDRAPADGVFGVWSPSAADGDYELRVLAFDHAGWEAEATVPVTVDRTPPQAAITQPAANALVGRGAMILGTASDAHFSRYRLRLAAAADEPPRWSDVAVSSDPVADGLLHRWDALPPDGRYRLQLRVEDLAGSSASAEVAVQVDAAPPLPPGSLTATVTGPGEVSLAWQPSTSPDVTGYRVERNGTPLAETAAGTTAYRDPGLPEGRHRYRVVAQDAAGNSSAPSETATVTIDLTPPEVALIAPPEQARVRALVDVIGTATSPDDFFEYRLYARPAGAPAPGALLTRAPAAASGELLVRWDTGAEVQERDFLLLLEAEDTRANIAAVERRVRVDNVPPAAPQGLAVGARGADSAELTWSANAEADLAGYLLYRDGQPLNPGAGPGADLRALALTGTTYLDTGIPDGVHEYHLRAIDLAGNLSPPGAPVEIEIETGPPTVTFAAPQPGQRFEAPLYLLAVSEDSDLASVGFEYRSAAGPWTALGAPDTAPPFEALLDAKGAGLAFGPVTIRALARDALGQLDPAPPELAVEYADLTAPAAVTGAGLSVAGGTVEISWSSGAEADLAGYVLTRARDEEPPVTLTPVPVAANDFTDPALADGAYAYAVRAEDEAGNRSPPVTLPAIVHTPAIEQPFTPTPVPVVSIGGHSIVAGQVSVRLENTDGAVELGPLATGPGGEFALADIPLAGGLNTFGFEVTDLAGNRSKRPTVPVAHSLPPAPPQDLAASVAGFRVDLVWTPPAATIAGYRPFRDGAPVLADGPPAETPAPSASSNPSLAANALDGNPFSYWYPSDADLAAGAPWLELVFSGPRLLTAVAVEWSREFNADLGQEVTYRPLDYRVQAWSGQVWVTLATLTGTGEARDEVAFAAPYLSDRIRLLSRAHSSELFRPVRLTEVGLTHRPFVATAGLTETLGDGRYQYRVSALSEHGFEGPQSAPVAVEVGDLTAPDPVVLQGALNGRDAELSWSASAAPDLAEYRLFRDGEPILLRRELNERSYTDQNLANGSYRYHVVAVDAAGNSSAPSNPVVLVVDLALPEAPSQLTATAVPGGGAVDLEWRAPGAGAAAYRVKRADSSGGPYAPIAEPALTRYRDSDVSNGETYYYVVTALDSGGVESAPSNEAAATPRDDQPPLSPVILHPTVAGVPVELTTAATAVAGAAEPGSLVTISVNGSLAGATLTPDALRAEHVALAGPPGVALSPAAPLVVRAGDPDRLEDLSTGQSRALPTRFGEGFYFAPRGEALFIKHGFNPVTVTRFDLVSGASETVLEWDSIDFVAPAPDGRGLFVQGAHPDPATGATERGLWLVDAAGAVERIGAFVDPDRFIEPESASWAPAGGRLAFVFGDASTGRYGLWRYRPAAGALTELHDDVDPNQATGWRPDGAAVAFVTRDRMLATIEPDGGQATIVGANANRPRWSPDARYLAFGSGCCELRVADTAGLEPDRALALEPSPARNWMPTGRMVALHFDGYSRIEAPGLFLLEGVPLAPGTNRIVATAADASGAASLPSAPVRVTAPASGLPDPAVLAAEVDVLPRAALPGHPFRATALVRNLAPEPAPPTAVQMMLFDPAGDARLLLDATVELPAHGQQPLALDLPGLAAPGDYRLDVFVDPLNRLVERDEANNAAGVVFAVVEHLVPLLTVRLDAPSFAPGETATGVVELYNPGPELSGMLRLSIADSGGFPLGWRRDHPVAALAFGDSVMVPFAWEPGAVFAGVFVLEAVLEDANGTVIATGEALITLERHAQLAIELDAAAGRVQVGDAVPLTAAVALVAGNTPQRGTIEWYAAAPDGRVVWRETSTLPTLLPGGRTAATVEWPAAGPEPGDHLIRAELVSEDGFALAELVVPVTMSQPELPLEGEVLSPAPVSIGAPLTVEYRLVNRSAQSLDPVPVRLALLPAGGTTPLLDATAEASLAAGAETLGSQTWPSDGLGLAAHLLVLSADLSAFGGTAAAILDTATVLGVDGVAPELSVIEPQPGAVVPADVLLEIRAEDRLQLVAAVTLSLDGGAEQRLGQAADGRYRRWLFGLAEGAHRVRVGASDTWGNRAQRGPIEFTVDATAPAIAVSGIADGELRNAPVTPEISVTDAHLDQTRVFLNGAPFTPGDTIALEGGYTLNVTATDLAGNRGELSLRFELDLTAPAVTLLDPLPGAELTEPTIAIVGSTEPAATVTLSGVGLESRTDADPAGDFLFPAVPLVLGLNEFRLSAIDRAGNAGDEVLLTLTRLPAEPRLGGALDAPASTAAGADLVVGYRLDNAGGAAQLAVRVRLLAGTRTVATVTGQADVPAGGATAGSATFAGELLEPALHRLELEVDAGAGWETLASAALAVLDLTAPVLSPLAPAALTAADFEIVATAVDAHGVIAAVEYALDGAPGQALALRDPATGTYAAQVSDAAHGQRQLELRASDDAGNRSAPVVIAFEVDAQAPEIVVAGVADGDLTNRAVRPEIEARDDHPGTVEASLDGGPFTSGSPVTGDGEHRLSVTATDAVGNRAHAVLRFVIDTVAPLIELQSPADGEQLAQAAVAVIGVTEPLAQVDLNADAHAAATSADGAGRFGFDPVALRLGANRLYLSALDRAGNRGPEAVLDLTRVDPGAVRGELAPLSDGTIGRTLAVSYRLTNDGAVTIVGVRSRIVVVAVGDGTRRGDAELTQSLDGGASVLRSAQFATETWQPGPHRVELQFALDAQAWSVLDSEVVELSAGAPPTLTLVVSFPRAGSVIEAGVTDVRGETLPGASVSVLNPRIDAAQGGYRRSVVADQAGRFRFGGVPVHPGPNTLTLEAELGGERAVVVLGLSGPAAPIPIADDWRWLLVLVALLAAGAGYRLRPRREGRA